MKKISYMEAAERFVANQFPSCEAAILAGSVVQGGATETSDLDIVILDESGPGPFRRTYKAFGWVIEAFVLTKETYRYFFDQGIECAIPSLLRMCAEGVPIRGHETVLSLAEEARRDLLAGPPAWSRQELDQARYEIGEALHDLLGTDHRGEGLFIAAKLAEGLAAFALRTGGQWLGDGKWMYRSLERFNPDLGKELLEALNAYYKLDRKEPLAVHALSLLEPYGGILTEGYSEGEMEGFGDRVGEGG